MSEIQNLEKREIQVESEIIENKKIEPENTRKHKLAGNIIRSRAMWISEGEKPTNYFCNLESRTFTSKIIPKVEIDKQFEILKETET